MSSKRSFAELDELEASMRGATRTRQNVALTQAPDNPYFHWGPIRDQRYFYDREDETHQIRQAINHGQCVSLVGPCKIGITSLLFHLEGLNRDGSSGEEVDCVYVYVDGQAHLGTEPSAFYFEILHEINEVLTTQDRSIRPVEEPKDRMELTDLRRAISSLAHRKIRPVILIDEFDVLCENQNFDRVFFSGLRSLATLGVVYVTASKRTLFQLNREKEIAGSPFYNYFLSLSIGLFDEESTLRLIREPSAEHGVHFDDPMVTEIFRLAGRHPFFTQQVCYVTFEVCRVQKGALREQDLEQVRARSRQELEDQMASYWEDLGPEEQQILLRVATDKALQQVSEVTLDNLVRQCLLVKSDGNYHIFSALFKDYVCGQARPELLREQKWLDRFQDWEELGRGAMSIVYKAYQPALERYVAIKELIPQTGLLNEDTERFRREMRSIAHLDHPNILPVYGFYPEVDRAYIVMKYAVAGSLADRLNEAKLPFNLTKAVETVIYIGRALGYAHRQEIIHRDIKPANIFMGEDDWPLLGDFGLSLSKGESSDREARMSGSFDYVAPEQARDARVADERSDIYSLGLVLYHLLVGKVPYAEEASVGSRLHKRLTQGVPPPRSKNSQISLEMERIILKATSPNPDDRYQTAEEMVEKLESAQVVDAVEITRIADILAGAPQTITWLHLSDLHFRASDTYDENIVLKALLRDIGERIAQDGLRPDFVIISGDIAFASLPEEYTIARQFLDDLLKTTALPKDRLFLVPGNHDVDRSAITAFGARATAALNSREAVNDFLATEADRAHVFRRFHNYRDFIHEYLGEEHIPFDHTRYFYVKEIEIAERRVAIMGLNSAWLAGSDDDRNKLLLGERQVRTALGICGDANLCLAVMHHPFDWLQDFDCNDVEPLLCKGCDFVLHGHTHREGLLQTRTPDTEAMIIAAGACYKTREHLDSYNFVQLNLGARKGTVHLRMYSDRGGGFWTKDVMNYEKVPDGMYSFQLSERLCRSLEGVGIGAVAHASGSGRQSRTATKKQEFTKMILFFDGVESFGDQETSRLLAVLTDVLRIDSEQVRIVRVQSGSLHVELELPLEAAQALEDLLSSGQLDLASLMRQIVPPEGALGGGYNVHVVNAQGVTIGDKVQVRASRSFQDEPLLPNDRPKGDLQPASLGRSGAKENSVEKTPNGGVPHPPGVSQSVSGRRDDTTRLLVSALIVVVVFAVSVAVLVWAAQRVSPAALVLVLAVAVVFDLVSTVSVLVLARVIRPKWAMDFFNAVLKKVPMLPLSSYPQPGPVSAGSGESNSPGDEGGQGE